MAKVYEWSIMDHIKLRKKNHAFLTIETEPGIDNELTDFFAFRPNGYQFMPAFRQKRWDGFLRLYNMWDKELPSGLYPYVYEFAKSRDYTVEVEYDPVYGSPDTKGNFDLQFIKSLQLSSRGKKIDHHDYQLEAIEDALTNKGRLLISPTASGKSLIIYSIIRHYLEKQNKKVLIVTPTTSLVEQMNGDFADYSEYDESYDAGETNHLIYSGKEKQTEKRVVISTWQSIFKKNAQWFSKFGMVIVDEAHTATAKSLASMMGKCKEAEYRIGTTGTIKKDSKANKLQLEGLFGPAYYVTTTNKLIEKGKLSQFKIEFIILKYNEKDRIANKKKKYQEEVDFLVQNEKRNKFISNLALDQEGNTVVLFQFVEKHGKPLYEMIKREAHEKRKVFFVSGETDVKTREEIRHITEKEKNAIIVASFGVMSTGTNIRNLHNVIFASPSKSSIKVLQSIGRVLRLSDDGVGARLYDLADDLSYNSWVNYTLKHGAERVKIYANEKFKYKIHEVNM
jgi:superfamily II DNA or RNA helicase